MGLFRVVKRRNADGSVERTRTWYGRFKHPVSGKWKRITLETEDKRLAERRLHRAILDAEANRGNKYREHHETPLEMHLEDYERSCRRQVKAGQRKSDRNIGTVITRVDTAFTECAFVFWPDITKARFERFLADLRGRGEHKGSTVNKYIIAAKSFLNWMVENVSQSVPTCPRLGSLRTAQVPL